MHFSIGIFQLEMRNVGIIAMSDRLHLYMAAEDVLTPYYASVDYSIHNTQQFTEWCQKKIEESLGELIITERRSSRLCVAMLLTFSCFMHYFSMQVALLVDIC